MNSFEAKIYWQVPNLSGIVSTITAISKIPLKSGFFQNNEFPDVKWELVLQLDANDLDHIEVWLCQFGPGFDEKVNTEYTITAIKNEARVEISKATISVENQYRLGHRRIDSLRLLSLGDFRLHCKVKTIRHTPIANLLSFYRTMLNDEKFADFTIKIVDKNTNVVLDEIKAHRNVLAQNEAFRSMMGESGMVEAQQLELTINDFTPDCVRGMLEFFYTGKVSTDKLDKCAEKIYEIADKYQILPLKYECELFMASNFMDTQRILRCRDVLMRFPVPILKEACLSYIRENSLNVLEAWLRI
ncbi:hypothetical protein ACQ4LE_010813 [Meloidogyne hapla]